MIGQRERHRCRRFDRSQGNVVDEQTVLVDRLRRQQSQVAEGSSAQGTGAVVWGLLEQTADVDAVVAALVSWTGADVDEVSLAVSAFVDDAQAHLLGERAARSTSVAAEYVGARPTTWSTPRLEAFSDLEDLLLLDPIHDVVEAVGWPAQKPTV